MIPTRENMHFVRSQTQIQTQEGSEALSREEVVMGAWAADPDRPLASTRGANRRWPELGVSANAHQQWRGSAGLSVKHKSGYQVKNSGMEK